MRCMFGLAVAMALGLIVVSGCDRSLSPEEQKRKDAADVAAVEAIQKIEPPIKPITLQPITPEDITAKNLGGAGAALARALTEFALTSQWQAALIVGICRPATLFQHV